MPNNMKVKTGDKVQVIAGKDKGKEGVILRAMPKEGRVVVEKCNMVKKAMRPTQANPQGGIMTMEAPLNVSNVMLVCPNCGTPTRVSIDRTSGKRVRVCKKCGKPIDK